MMRGAVLPGGMTLGRRLRRVTLRLRRIGDNNPAKRRCMRRRFGDLHHHEAEQKHQEREHIQPHRAHAQLRMPSME